MEQALPPADVSSATAMEQAPPIADVSSAAAMEDALLPSPVFCPAAMEQAPPLLLSRLPPYHQQLQSGHRPLLLSHLPPCCRKLLRELRPLLLNHLPPCREQLQRGRCPLTRCLKLHPLTRSCSTSHCFSDRRPDVVSWGVEGNRRRAPSHVGAVRHWTVWNEEPQVAT
ncbi:hypothetical protein UPYG_G00126170 [Umbra pygmaea]|uniref:C3H1-type domain-containing protein n=1 Tax=Umbra pygmaea TaxID=75934 RepID=A0ABD0X628_UMBPY